MPEPLAIPDREILERLRARYDLDAGTLEFLPIGYDADAWTYRVHTGDGDRFLKIRRGPTHEAGPAVPHLLAARGIPHLIEPIPTVTGAPFDEGDLSFILFPFVEGESGGRVGLSPAQWAELGATMRSVHDLPFDDDFGSILRTEDFVPTRAGLLREVDRRVGAGEEGDDPARRALADLWRSRRDQIERLAARTEALAPLARDRRRPFVICHADIHAWNVLVPPSGDIVIVDWDDAMLAPRERDLMFVDGVAGGHAADPPAFFHGYGDGELDPVVLAYYRVEWAEQDLAGFAATIVLDPDAGDTAMAESLDIITKMLAPGGEIEIVTRAHEP